MKNILSFLIELRRHYPAEQRMHIIMDNLPAHWTPDIVKWAKGNSVTLVPAPTNASWLNPIETHFNDIQKIALSGTDFRSWDKVTMCCRKQSGTRTKTGKKCLMQGTEGTGGRGCCGGSGNPGLSFETRH